MGSASESRLMKDVIECEAGDFMRAMKCRGSKLISLQDESSYVSVNRVSIFSTGAEQYVIRTELNDKPYQICFEYSDGWTLMCDSCVSQDELARLTLDATHDLCSQIIAAYDDIEESTLMLLPLYRGACEELSHSPEEAASWLLEKGIHYHAAKNFLQGEKDDHSTNDFSTRFYGYHA